MTDGEKLEILRNMLDDSDTTSDEVAESYLAAAEKAVINLAYPYGDGSEVTIRRF